MVCSAVKTRSLPLNTSVNKMPVCIEVKGTDDRKVFLKQERELLIINLVKSSAWLLTILSVRPLLASLIVWEASFRGLFNGNLRRHRCKLNAKSLATLFHSRLMG